MTLVRFNRAWSLLTGNGMIYLYGSGGERDHAELPGATETSEAVWLDDGLVHIATTDGLYQVQSDEKFLFVIQKVDSL